MTTVLLVSATILALAGCGSSSAGGADPADVAAVSKQVSAGGEFTKAQANCVAVKATPKLSAKGLKLAKKASSSDVSELSKSDQEVVFSAVGACVTTAQLAPGLMKAFSTGKDKVPSAEAKCFTKAVVKAYPNTGDLMRDMSGGKTTKMEKALTSCVTDSLGGSSDGSTDTSGSGDSSSSGSGSAANSSEAAIIRSTLIDSMTQGGMTKAQAECVADKVLGEISTADLADAGSAGSLPADLQSKVVAAVGQCASAG